MCIIKLTFTIMFFLVTSLFTIANAEAQDSGLKNVIIANYKTDFSDLGPDIKERIKNHIAQFDADTLKEVRIYVWPDKKNSKNLAEDRIQCLQHYFEYDLKFTRVRYYDMSNRKGAVDAYKYGNKEKLRRLKLDPNMNYSKEDNFSKAILEIVVDS